MSRRPPRSALFRCTALFRCRAFQVASELRISSGAARNGGSGGVGAAGSQARSEEHTSELQSQSNLVCRLLLEKKKQALPTRDGQGIAQSGDMTHGLGRLHLD